MQRFVVGIVLAMPLAAAAFDAAIENPDTHFYQRAAEANLAEVDGGMLAQQRSESPAVKIFAQMMVKDHTLANHTLRDLAIANHVDLPEQPNSEQRAKRAVLQGLSGDAFDRAYIESQILLHKDAIALFKEESSSGDDLAARHYASEWLPTLQSHLNMLMTLPVTAAPPPSPAAPSPP